MAASTLFAQGSASEISVLAGTLPDVDPEGIAASAVTHLEAPLDGAHETAWWHLTFFRWCELDRKAAGEFVLAHSDDHPNLLRILVAAASKQDPRSARMFADTMGGDALRIYDAAIAKEDAAAETGSKPLEDKSFTSADLDAELVRVLGDERSRKDRIRALNSFISPMASTDPEGALARIEELDVSPDDRRLLLESLTRSVGQAPPASVARMFSKLPTSPGRWELAVNTARRWAEDDPAAAEAWADSLPPGPEQDAALASAASEQAEDNPLAIFDILESRDWKVGYRTGPTFSKIVSPSGGGGGGGSWGGGSMQYTVRDALQHLVEEGRPADAMDKLARIHDPDARRWLIGETLEKWIETDGAAAIEWLDGAPENNSLNSTGSWVARGLRPLLKEGEFDEAINLVGKLSDPDDIEYVLRNVMRDAAEGSHKDGTLDALVGWSGTFAPEERNRYLGSIVGGLERKDPATAAELMQGLDMGDDSNRRWSSVMENWMRVDAVAAAEFLSQGSHPDTAYSSATTEWMRSDPQLASQWVAALPRGSSRDAAVESMITELSSGGTAPPDFEAALAWAGEISDPAKADKAIDRVLSRWQQAEPDTAPSR